MWSLSKAVLFALLYLLVEGLCSLGAEPPADIAQAIRQLGDDAFAVREKAAKFLWSAGRAAEPALQAVLKSGNPEVATRARSILERFKYGIYPDTPPHIVELVQQFRSGAPATRQATVNKLLALGGPGYTVVLKLAAAEGDPAFRNTLFERLLKEGPQISGVLLFEGKLDAVEDLLGTTALCAETGANAASYTPSIRNYAAFLLLRGTLAKKIAQLTPRPGTVREAEILAYLYRAQGNLPSAFRAAEEAGDRRLQKWLLWEQGKWQDLLDQHPPQEEIKGRDDIESLGFRAAYQRLAGHTKDFEKTIAEIRQVAKTRKTDADEAWFNTKPLWLNDRPQDAAAVLIEAKRYGTAFEVLKHQMRYREALALADKVKDEKHGEVFRLAVLRATTLYEVGDKQKALLLIARLGDDVTDPTKKQWEFQELIRIELKLGLKEQALAHAAGIFARAPKDFRPVWLLHALFPNKQESAEVWWTFLRSRFVAEDHHATLKRLGAILDGTLERPELETLVRAAAEQILESRELKTEERERRLRTIAETCLAAGLEKRAQQYFEEAVELAGAPAALLRLADFLAEKKHWPQAAALYGQAWQKDKQAPLPLFLQGWALAHAAKKAEGEKLMQLAHWLPLARDEVRYELAVALGKRGLDKDALREWELLVRLGEVDSAYTCNAQQPLATDAAARGQFLEAAARRELFMLPCLNRNTSFLETAPFLRVPHRVHRDRARGLLAAGKTAEALKEIQTCLLILPAHVDTAILLVPLLEKGGCLKDADELFGKVRTYCGQLCTDYPRWAHAHNLLAWLCARCRRQLDVALTHAQQAVELAPKSAAYLDTLAEVYFQRGDQARAITLMRRCIDLEPQRDFFRAQLKRFEHGDRFAEVPRQ